jgi:hypothetical protein
LIRSGGYIHKDFKDAYLLSTIRVLKRVCRGQVKSNKMGRMAKNKPSSHELLAQLVNV